MRRRYRLRSRERFAQVRRQGQSYKDRLTILVCLRNDLPYSRVGFTASRRVGNAVKRNRARRLLRESVRLRFPGIDPGWDMVFIARPHIVFARFQQVDAACGRLLEKAALLTATKDADPTHEATER